jgi:hypothetical protein
MSSRESPGNRARQRATRISQRVQSREAKLNELRAHYAKHGDRVMSAILHTFNQEGDLRRLVHRVTGRVVSREARQHEVLAEFLIRHGENVFLRQAGFKGGAGNSENGQEESEEPLSPEDEPVAEIEERDEPKIEENIEGRQRVKLPTGEIITDRRTGQERRSGSDRRDQLETVFKNKRFGGERRRGEERRLTPPDYLGD